MGKTVLIAGASGVVGSAAMRHFAEAKDCDVISLSRRKPDETFGTRFVSVDLTGGDAGAALDDILKPVTHLVFSALFEKPQLVAGWRDVDQIATNASMLGNILEPLTRTSTRLKHVAILQGTKAYGVHVRSIPIPAREDRDESYDVPNFYWEQERYLRAKQSGQSWSWTIFRPQLTFGRSIGSAMNVIAAIGTYGAVLKAHGEPLHFPGRNPNILQATDSDILARAIDWAGRSSAAANQIFNITNGDVFLWQSVWPVIADSLGMRVGDHAPQSMASEMPRHEATWKAIRARHNLLSPDLNSFVGRSFQFADSLMGYDDVTRNAPSIVSTIKLQSAGFGEVLDSEKMLRKWVRAFQEQRLLPPL